MSTLPSLLCFKLLFNSLFNVCKVMLLPVRIAFNIFIQSYYSTALIWFYFNCVFSYIKIYIFVRETFDCTISMHFEHKLDFLKLLQISKQHLHKNKKHTWFAAGTEKVFRSAVLPCRLISSFTFLYHDK